MRKFIILLTATVLVSLAWIGVSLADYKDMAGEVETSLEVWVGGYAQDVDSSKVDSLADIYSPTLPEAASRVPYSKAAEYYYLDDSPSGGILFKDAHAPNRLHLEFDYYNEGDWFGDFRYSFKDYFLSRVLSRRLTHNLENLTIYDWTGAESSVVISDKGIDDYKLTVDIDQYLLRFKTPNYPLHVYSDGEIIRKKGKKQLRFAGGQIFRGSVDRNTISRDVDQEKQEFSLGTNGHFGPVELDVSRKWRQFESDVAPHTYLYGNDTLASSEQAHNTIPELEATTDTLKIHTSHSGRLYASGTLSQIEKTNNDTTAEAENKMAYGEVFWLPASYVSFSAKYRHQKNESEAPATVLAYSGDPGPGGPGYGADTLNPYPVEPGVESTTDTAILTARYSQIPKTSVKFQYTNKIKEYEDESVVTWSRPKKQVYNIYEVGLSNWAIPKFRITSKFRQTNIDHDLFEDPTGTLDDSVTNDPENTYHGNLGLTWLISPRVAAFASASLTQEETDNSHEVHVPDTLEAEALRQQYIASLSFTISEKLSISPTYTYMCDEQKRDIVWEDGTGAMFIDKDYNNEQVAHNASLNVIYLPSKRLTINGSIDYTVTEGTYKSPYNAIFTTDPAGPPPPFQWPFFADNVTEFSNTKTQELGVRLDSDFDLGRGWGVGLGLRYIDWQDDSFDNPSDSTFIGGLLKLTKKIL